MKRAKFYLMGILAVLFFSAPVFSGDLAPSDSRDRYSTYTFDDIYNRLSSGTDRAKTVAGSAPSGAISPTDHDLNEIMQVAPALDDNTGAGLGDVISGKTFWGLKNGVGWGTLTGAIKNIEITSSDLSTSTEFSAGVYPAFNLQDIDSDLTADNIKRGTVMFGLEGGYVPLSRPNGVAKTTGEANLKCVDLMHNHLLSSCEGNIYEGQDAKEKAGIPWPVPRFVDNPDGTVTDNLTGLIWLKNANCVITYSSDINPVLHTKTWAPSLKFINHLGTGQCGLTDGSIAREWRLPNIKELQSLVDYGRVGPALPAGHPFTGFQSAFYWSSTTGFPSSFEAWGLDFNTGKTMTQRKWEEAAAVTGYILPVRGPY